MPEVVDECVESVLADNPGMDKSTAFAICNDQFDTAKLLSMKTELGLSDDEFVEAVKLLNGHVQ